MPEQPKDPIHYDMKIPPETKHSDDDNGSGNTESDEGEGEGENAKDSKVVRGDDKPQSVRH